MSTVVSTSMVPLLSFYSCALFPKVRQNLYSTVVRSAHKTFSSGIDISVNLTALLCNVSFKKVLCFFMHFEHKKKRPALANTTHWHVQH